MPNSKYYQKYYKSVEKDEEKYEEYKKYMKEYQKQKYYCKDCNKEVSIGKKYKHLKTKKHLINTGQYTKPDKIKCHVCNTSVYEKNLEKHCQSSYHKANLSSKEVEFLPDSDIDSK